MVVGEDADGARLDTYLAGAIEDLSRTRAAALAEAGCVLVDGEAIARAAHRLRAGQCIVVAIPEPVRASAKPQSLPLEILYEDADLVVIDKAPGMVVHPAAGHADGTLVNALLARIDDLSGVGGELRPGIVHRLDKGTSGLILAAKNDAAHDALSRQFAERTVTKIYLALTAGQPSPARGLIDRPIGRDPSERKRMAVDTPHARPARTRYAVLAARGGLAAVECRIETGRTHQVRVHMKAIGCPLAGDETYGGKRAERRLTAEAQAAIAGIDRPALHAWLIAFAHPTTGAAMRFVAPPCADLRPALEFLGIGDLKKSGILDA
ncbi:RluA family pseudouridine synthase [bacterium]|nr:RluA family pseudouridine synthase [bacterium]